MRGFIKLHLNTNLNTQSCIKELLGVQDFSFWAVWAAVQKKKSGADCEQLLRVFFRVFGVKKNLKHYRVSTKKVQNTFFISFYFLSFFFDLENMIFLFFNGLRKFSNLSALHKYS